jgi:hypothetical protein
MTPKEKAEELVDKFYQTTPNEAWINEPLGIAEEYKAWNQAKQCALIAVDEIIDEVYNISHQYAAIYNEETKFYNYTESKELKFWQEVKKEIEAL